MGDSDVRITFTPRPDGSWHWDVDVWGRSNCGDAPTRLAAQIAAWGAERELRAEHDDIRVKP